MAEEFLKFETLRAWNDETNPDILRIEIRVDSALISLSLDRKKETAFVYYEGHYMRSQPINNGYWDQRADQIRQDYLRGLTLPPAQTDVPEDGFDLNEAATGKETP